MDIDRFKYFITIVEAGSLTKASKILGISHSGLSKAVSTLESETKTVLFRPQGRGLEITAEGKWLYQKALEVLALTDVIGRGQQPELQLLRIGLSEVIAVSCSGLLSAEFEESIAFHQVEVGELEGKIISNEIDFGVAFVPSPKPELEYLALGEIRFNAFVREDLLKKGPSVDIPFVVPASEYPFNPAGYKNRDGWPKDIKRLSRFFVSSFAIALDLVRKGQCAVYMPDFLAKQENANTPAGRHIKVISEFSQARSKRKVYLVKRQSQPESKEMKKVSRILRQVCCSKA
jgi:DNA-binding transcriptional LysR family regulator